uniref:Uncharacterized protein n=1 Tax=viral metagenome TaxID=1070528 RepID=A0A6C0CHP8_9ZZZZ
MLSDSTSAIVVVGILLVVISYRSFSYTLLELLMQLTRPGATVLLLSVVGYLLYKNYLYTGLALAVVAVYLLKDLWSKYPQSDARRLYNEQALDQKRFDPRYSVDLQWANKSATHDKPALYFQTGDPKLLVFPPSEEVLHELCG